MDTNEFLRTQKLNLFQATKEFIKQLPSKSVKKHSSSETYFSFGINKQTEEYTINIEDCGKYIEVVLWSNTFELSFTITRVHASELIEALFKKTRVAKKLRKSLRKTTTP